MAKITRQTQQIFAGQAPSDELAVFGTMKTGTPVYSSELSQLQSSDYQQGWQNAIITDKAPFLEEMNGVMYGTTYQLAYLMQQGIPEWDAGTTYYTNSCVMGSDGNIYKSLTDDNTGNNPTTDSGTNWVNIIDGLYNKITNCILSAPNGVATYSGSTITVKQGLKVLIPNGRNADGTLNNIEYVVPNDISLTLGNYTERSATFLFLEPQLWDTPIDYVPSSIVFKQDIKPTINGNFRWYDTKNNKWYIKDTSTGADQYITAFEFAVGSYTNGQITSLTPYQPVELVKRSDLESLTPLNPTGTIIAYGSATAPNGYLKCNGATISRSTYSELFNVIGTTYGTGDGSTTFNIPNFTGGVVPTSNNVAVKGNGRAIGFRHASIDYSFIWDTNSRNTSYGLQLGTGNVNGDINAGSNNVGIAINPGVVGLSTDSNTSGIVGTLTSKAINYYIKY